MIVRPATPREAKAAFLVADGLKPDSRRGLSYRAASLAARAGLAAKSDDEIDSLLRAKGGRHERYNAAAWSLCVVDLALCLVWPGMGGKAWARGRVGDVAALAPHGYEPGHRVWAMRGIAQGFESFADIPLIAFQRRREDAEYQLDDGCHRAVAFCLAGFRQAFAIVGHVPSSRYLPWVR